LNRYRRVREDFNSQKILPLVLAPTSPFSLEVTQLVSKYIASPEAFGEAATRCGLSSGAALVRFAALGASSSPRLARQMLSSLAEGKVGAILAVEAREGGVEFADGFQHAPIVSTLIHDRLFKKNAALWASAGITCDDTADMDRSRSAVLVATKLAEYVDSHGRDWTQLMQPLSLAEAQAAWSEVHKYGGVELPDDAAAGLTELAANNFIRVIDQHVFPTSALRILADRDMPPWFVSEQEAELRSFMHPGDRRNQAEWRQKEQRDKEQRAKGDRWAFYGTTLGAIATVIGALALFHQVTSNDNELSRQQQHEHHKEALQVQREQHEQALQQQRELLKALLAAAAAGLVMVVGHAVAASLGRRG
jgi:hypothetical protein